MAKSGPGAGQDGWPMSGAWSLAT
jgi:hypothetical protein